MNTTKINGIEFSACACACGEATTKSTYRPGHDARHAGQVGREMLRTGDLDLVFELGTAALREKANRFYLKRAGDAADRIAEEAEEPQGGKVKLGRWSYPARMNRAGKIERNTKRDGSGSWEPVSPQIAATFTTEEN